MDAHVNRIGAGLLAAAVLMLCQGAPSMARAADKAIGAAIASAVSDPSRPATDTARDANRKPAQTLEFAGVKPGDAVVDYIANTGYFTRLFSSAVGPRGHVYAVELNEIVTVPNVAPGYAQLKAWAASRPNVTVSTVPVKDSLNFPDHLDVFWISQNYHDLHDKFLGPVDVAAFNRAVYAALKPGGVYVVLDHVAAKGAPADVTETLHRIEPSVVRREVEAAGFEFAGESDILANPQDPHTAGVFNPSIRGRTDQFLFRFRKPG
jgi:predicted methyltransferase